MLDIDVDPDKNAWNVVHHGIPLSDAAAFELDRALKFDDERDDYGERRILAIGRLNRKVYVLIYTERGGRTRVISLRKADKDERQRFELYRS